MDMRRILLVEDDERQARELCRHLRQENLLCGIVPDIDYLNDRLSHEPCDCLVLDLQIGERDPYDIIALIPTLSIPVAVYTGNTDPQIVEAVRHTGAAYVEKPGIDLLVNEIWAQINYRHADQESAVRQQVAQRNLRTAKPLFASRGAIISLVTSLMIPTVGFGAWAFQTLSGAVTKTEETKHRFEKLEARTETLAQTLHKMEELIDIIRNQNQISVDERRALRENQQEMKIDIKERLDYITKKLDSR